MENEVTHENIRIIALADEILSVMSGNPQIVVICALVQVVSEFFHDNPNIKGCMKLFSRQVLRRANAINKGEV